MVLALLLFAQLGRRVAGYSPSREGVAGRGRDSRIYAELCPERIDTERIEELVTAVTEVHSGIRRCLC
jgi:hypothetical protein